MKTTRDEIINKAATLFIQRGYHAVPVKDIAAEVNINPSGLFFHFKNKEEIYQCAVEKYVVNAMNTDSKFGDCSTMSLSAFLDHYLVCVKKTIKSMHALVKMKENTARAYYGFMLECGGYKKKYAERMLKTDEEEILLWESVIRHAQENGEVKNNIPAYHIAKIFRRAFVGTSYTKTQDKGVTISELRELFDDIYSLVKN